MVGGISTATGELGPYNYFKEIVLSNFKYIE